MNKVRLRDVLTVKRGASLPGEFYSNTGEYIRLTLGNFAYPGGGFKANTSKKDLFYIGEIRPEFILKKGDIITPLTEQVRGLLGETATIPEDNKYIQSGDIGLIIPNENLLNKRYAYYLISSPIIKKQLDAGSQQTKIRHTSPEAIMNCIAYIPDIDEQLSIASFLDKTNKKIETNNTIISELESMAKDIYDYWFVQFDFPDENGKPYKSSGGKMVWNEDLKREIPEGWKCGPLQNICNIHRGASPRPIDSYMDVSKKGIPWVKISDATCDSSPFLIQTKEYIKPEGVKKSVIVYPGTLIVSNSATPGIPKFMDIDACVHDGWLVIDGYRSSYRYYLYYLMQNIRNSLLNIASGSVFKNLKTDYLKEYLCFVPSEEILIKFDNTIAPIMNLLLNMLRETKELASLRDFLLPLLMNGQVKIGEMEP